LQSFIRSQVAALRGSFYRNVWTAVPTGKAKEVAGMLKAIHAQEDAKAAKEKALQIIEKLKIMRLAKAAEIVENGIEETLSYYSMPAEHWRCLPIIPWSG
jgi:putative transposase